MRHIHKVAIIGAGTAGLTAQAEVSKKTDNYVVIDGGALGTTCARVGCMPSKALIQVANSRHEQALLNEFGVLEASPDSLDYANVMRHVRSLRDRFTGGVRKSMDSWQDHLIQKQARFIDPNTLDLGDETILADKIIIAAGAKPFIPEKWRTHDEHLVNTDHFFEMETLPPRMAVIGLGPIGIELGQALVRLGVDVIAISINKALGGLTDPLVQDYAHQVFADAMSIRIGQAEIVGESEDGITVGCDGETWTVDRVLTAMGRHPAVDGLGLENLGVELDDRGLPPFDETTLQIEGLPVFIAGDVNGTRPLLHEASDEGRIAGYNAVTDDVTCFQKRTALAITFADPNIAVIGQSHAKLKDEGTDFVVGESTYNKQGRAMMMGRDHGIARLYADKKEGRLLGAELAAPHGEHLAHLIAWAIACEMRASDVLSMPFYHPVLEEGLRKAFRETAKQSLASKPRFEMLRCQDAVAG